MIDIKKLESLKNELEKNPTIQKVYNINDNKNFNNEIAIFNNFNDHDYQEVFEAFRTNISFLKEYTVETDDKSRNTLRINELIFDIYNDFGNDDNDNILSYLHKDNNKRLLITLQNMVVLYASTSIEEKDITKLVIFNDDSNYAFLYNSENKYYRGESDFSYKLLPSIYRNYNVSKYGNTMTIKTLFSLYKDSQLLDKYATVFDYKYIDYNFCAYMQHSKAYSPLLDLTSEPRIALSFATNSSGDLNKYLKTDASLYEFSFKNIKKLDENDTKIFAYHNVFVVDGRLRISSTVKGVILCKCTYRNFAIDVSIFNEKVNDRMKYQKGSFLYINNSVIVNGIMMMPISMGKITKYKISPANKRIIYNSNRKNCYYYDYEHLMNPYLFFDEAPNS